MDDEDDDLWGSDGASGDEDAGKGSESVDGPITQDGDVEMGGDVDARMSPPEIPFDPTIRIDANETSKVVQPNLGSSGIPANILRRQLFKPTPESLTQHLALDPFIVIPQPGHVHSLAATPCMSYLLTGSEDGHVRAYDFWASANGKNMLSTQQRAMATLGEGVNKGGVVRGYYKNDVEMEEYVAEEEEQPQAGGSALPWMQAARDAQSQKEVVKVRKMQPVYSMAIHSDGLWVVTGTETGLINLATLRHDPGKIAHVFDSAERHTKAVSALVLTTDEQHMVSGGWDNQIKEWDLNTGQVVRSFNQHKGPISAIQFQPISLPSAPAKGNTVSITTSSNAGGQNTKAGESAEGVPPTNENGEEAAAGSPDSYGSLFGDEEEDENTSGKRDKPQGNGAHRPSISKPDPPAVPPGLPFLPAKEPSVIPPSRPGILSQPRVGIPPLGPETYKQFSDDVMLVASMDGDVALHDRRIDESLVGKLEPSPKSGPWCMSACFSADGTQVIAGRRNASLDVWDIRKSGTSGTVETPNLLRKLRHPATSQWVSAVAAFPDGKHIACASVDCVRLWNTADLWNPESSMKKSKSGVPFRIVAGHHGGTVSKIHIDPTGQFMITATGNRGWAGDATKVVLVHERK